MTAMHMIEALDAYLDARRRPRQLRLVEDEPGQPGGPPAPAAPQPGAPHTPGQPQTQAGQPHEESVFALWQKASKGDAAAAKALHDHYWTHGDFLKTADSAAREQVFKDLAAGKYANYQVTTGTGVTAALRSLVKNATGAAAEAPAEPQEAPAQPAQVQAAPQAQEPAQEPQAQAPAAQPAAQAPQAQAPPAAPAEVHPIVAAWEKARQGGPESHEAIGEIHRHFGPTMLAAALRRTKDRDDAEDAVQQTMLKLASGKYSGEGAAATSEASVRNQLNTATLRSAQDRAKKEKIRRGAAKATGDDGEQLFDPEAKSQEGGLDPDEIKDVVGTVKRILDHPDLNDTPKKLQDREFLARYWGAAGAAEGEIREVEAGDQVKLAMLVWPELTKGSAKNRATILIQRWTPQLASELGHILAGPGHQRTSLSPAAKVNAKGKLRYKKGAAKARKVIEDLLDVANLTEDDLQTKIESFVLWIRSCMLA